MISDWLFEQMKQLKKMEKATPKIQKEIFDKLKIPKQKKKK